MKKFLDIGIGIPGGIFPRDNHRKFASMGIGLERPQLGFGHFTITKIDGIEKEGLFETNAITATERMALEADVSNSLKNATSNENHLAIFWGHSSYGNTSMCTVADGFSWSSRTTTLSPGDTLRFFIDNYSQSCVGVKGWVSMRCNGKFMSKSNFNISSAADMGCYLTTAMVQHYYKDDDGPELTAMRKLREKYNIKHAKTLAEYYQVSPYIINGIETNKYREYYYDMIKNTVDSIVVYVTNDKWPEAEQAYLELYFFLKDKFYKTDLLKKR